MTEKEKILRKVLKEIVIPYIDPVDEDIMNPVLKALADTKDTCKENSRGPEAGRRWSDGLLNPPTEDTGGERCPECGGDGQRYSTRSPISSVSGKPISHSCSRCKGTGHLPPKEQDDRVVNNEN